MTIAESIRKKRGALLVWGALAAVVLLIFVFAATKRPPEKNVAEGEKAVPVRTVVVEPQDVADVIQLPGRIEPLQAANLAAQRAGQVVELLVAKGETVAEGQALLRLDSRLWAAARRRAEIEARDAAKDFARWQELEKSGAVSASEYEGVQRRKEAADIALDEARTMEAQCEVQAPFAGTVVDRLVEIGDYANEGQAVLRLIRLDRVKVAFDVPEQDITAVQPGQEKKFTLAAVPGRGFTGTVTFVSSQAARESNSFGVELEAGNADGALKAGMIAQVALVRRERAGAIQVPLAAIVPRKGEYFVFTVADGRAVRQRVILDSLTGQDAVLESGLAAGARVVVEGHRGLQDGMNVVEPAAGAELPAETAPEPAE